MENSMEVLQKLKIELPYDPAIPLLSVQLNEMKSGYGRGICTPMFIAALFTLAKILKRPTDPSTDDEDATHTHTHTHEYYSHVRIKEISTEKEGNQACHLQQYEWT